MNFRVTAILFAVVTVLVVALLLFIVTRDDTSATDDALFPTFAAVKADDVDTIELTRTTPDEQKLVFQRKDKVWVLTAPMQARVEGTALDAVVRGLLKAKPVRYDGAMENLTTLGLSQPTVTAVLRSGDKSATIRLGLTTIGKAQAVTFVTTGDQPETPVAVRASDLSSLFRDADREKGGSPHIIGKWLSDFRQKRLLTVDANSAGSDLESIKLTRGKQTLELALVDGEWRFKSPENYGVADLMGDSLPTPDRFTGVRPLLNALVNFQVNTVEDYIENVDPAQYGKYALATDDPTNIRVELKPRGLPAQALFIGKKVEKDGKPLVPTKVYCRVEGDPAVAMVPTDRLEAFINTVADPSDFRSRDLIVETKRDRIDAIDSTLTSGYRLRRVAGTTGRVWALYGGSNDPSPTHDQVVSNLIGTLARPRLATAVLLAPNDAAFAADQRKGELKVWFDSIEKQPAPADGKLPSEPKLTKEPVSLIFGQVVGNEVFVRRTTDGKSTDFKVPADVLVTVSKGRVDYFDPKLGSFSPLGVSSVVLFRKGERLEVKKDVGSDPGYLTGKWSFVAPDAQKGKPADSDTVFELVNVLSTLSAPRMTVEAPSIDELKKSGLDPAAPGLSMKVNLADGPEKEREYHFGNDTEDKANVYLRLVGKPYVFVVPRPIANQLTTADLTDKVVFRTDPKKVRKLFLNGWKTSDKGSAPQSVVLELQNGVWVSVDPASVGVEQNRVTSILAALEAPKALEVLNIPDGQPTPPEYGFGDNPLSIVAELEDKSSAYLMIGGPDKTKTSVYARADKKTVRLSPALILPVLEKPPLIGKK